MNASLQVMADRQGGVFTRAQARECGYSIKDVKLRVRMGEWDRLRRGVYVSKTFFRSLDDAGRYVVHIHAVMLVLERRAVVSHVSAAALYGLPLWGHDLSRVHVTRARIRGGRTEAGVHHHRGMTDPHQIAEREGVLVTAAARAVVEAAGLASYEAGVVLADAALNTRLTDELGLRAALDTMRGWPGSRKGGSVLAFADGRAESPGESRARVLFRWARLPEPELQASTRDGDGNLVGRVDFLFTEYNTIVEFDGKLKYGLGPTGAVDDLFREKRREDRLRELGYEIVRITWADLAYPDRVVARINAAAERARTRAHLASFRTA